MGRKALYREWRPRTFDEVVEQHHVVVSLRQSVRTGRIGHAYLFSGTRGTGKTTMAQIFSRAINCLDPQDGNPCNACEVCLSILNGSLLDVIEMDAASNNSVETIRRICDEVVFSPTRAKFKVYIIDEAHMLSTGAFNALLKTLEEPPSFAVFILATTEPHRIPATILSRCQRYDFRRIPLESIVTRLEEIAADSGVVVERDAYATIAALADGAMRDAISLLDQCLSSSPERLTKDDVLELAGIVNDAFMGDMAEAMVDGDAGAVLRLVDRLVMDGRDVVRFASDLAGQFRNIMVCRTTDDPSSLVRLPDAALARMKKLAARMDLADVIAVLRGLSALITDLKWAPDPRTTFEVGLIRLMPEAGLPKASGTRAAKPAAHAAVAVPPPVATPVAVRVTLPVAQKAEPAVAMPAAAVPTLAPVASTPVDDEPPLPSDDDIPPPPDDEPVLPVAPAAAPTSRPVPAKPASQVAQVPAPAPVAAVAAAPAAAVDIAVADADAAKVWTQTLWNLQENGHMGLYLFVRDGAPRFQDGQLVVRFSSDAGGHKVELERKETLKSVRAAVAAALGHDADVAFEYAQAAKDGPGGPDKPAEENWMGWPIRAV